jgi:hypothetical protein
MSMGKTIEQVYRERNLYAIAFAVVMGETAGIDAGYYYHESSWPVVWVDDGTTQAGVHVRPGCGLLLEQSPLRNRAPPDGYDGHGRADRLNYVMGVIEGVYDRP